MNFRTDLACEAYELHKDTLKDGIFQQKFNVSGIDFVKVTVTSDDASEKISKPKGVYITAFINKYFDGTVNLKSAVHAISEEIKKLIPNTTSPVLVAGIGNRAISPDALGPKAADRVIATRHLYQNTATASQFNEFRPVSVISPGTLAQTGIETDEIISYISSEIHPSAVILIDSLASKSTERLGNTIQISDSGISPGSGVMNARKEISPSSLGGIKVISIGVPTVVDAVTLAVELLNDLNDDIDSNTLQNLKNSGKSLIITPRDIDVILKRTSELISLSINKALQPFLGLEEILSILN
ncbi:MAG: GPR endopeptidase [Oscillospiraceae bacterium]|nr:GPR endopeptidase [Oscillospiraceae bacterium]